MHHGRLRLLPGQNLLLTLLVHPLVLLSIHQFRQIHLLVHRNLLGRPVVLQSVVHFVLERHFDSLTPGAYEYSVLLHLHLGDFAVLVEFRLGDLGGAESLGIGRHVLNTSEDLVVLQTVVVMHALE